MVDKKIIKTFDLGYDDFFESGRNAFGLGKYPVARVIAEYREAYRIRNEHGDFLAKITGKQMYESSERSDYPAVGDWVAITELEGRKAVIRGLLPRKTVLSRISNDGLDKQIIAANLDTAFITESMDRDFSLNRLERYLVLVREGSIDPIIVLNKTDLIPADVLTERTAQVRSRLSGIGIICSSTVSGQGLVDLKTAIKPGNTCCFLGSSGVGKSSLINAMIGKDRIRTRDVSVSTERGRHTTTAREMYFLDGGGIVIDNPGIREVGVGDPQTGLSTVFDEIGELSLRCRYSDCSHLREPGCAVLKAISAGELDQNRYDNYIKLKKETDYFRLTDLEKREKDRKFGKFVKKALQELKS